MRIGSPAAAARPSSRRRAAAVVRRSPRAARMADLGLVLADPTAHWSLADDRTPKNWSP